MSTNNIHSEINNTLFEVMTNNLNKVIECFNNGKVIVVFKGNGTMVLSNKLHSEAVLMKYLYGSTTVRICA